MISFKSRFRIWPFGPLSRQQEQQFMPTPEELKLIETFGHDQTAWNDVLESIETSGVPHERIEDVWKLIREQRRANWGKERTG